MTETEKLELRVHNLEVFIMGLAALIEQTTPHGYHHDVSRMTQKFYESQTELGALTDPHYRN